MADKFSTSGWGPTSEIGGRKSKGVEKLRKQLIKDGKKKLAAILPTYHMLITWKVADSHPQARIASALKRKELNQLQKSAIVANMTWWFFKQGGLAVPQEPEQQRFDSYAAAWSRSGANIPTNWGGNWAQIPTNLLPDNKPYGIKKDSYGVDVLDESNQYFDHFRYVPMTDGATDAWVTRFWTSYVNAVKEVAE